jgi:uridine kinase
MEQPYIIGITGCSASGKTSFVHRLKDAFPSHQVAVVSQDNYYKPLDLQPRDAEGHPHFDLPESIDMVRFGKDLTQLKSGNSISYLEYTFNNKDATPNKIEIQPAPIIIMEGLFIFHSDEIRNQLDLKIYIDSTEDVMWERRLKRDQAERGLTAEWLIYQWNNHVLPSYKQFLKPYKYEADLVVHNIKSYDLCLQMVIDHFNAYLERNND